MIIVTNKLGTILLSVVPAKQLHHNVISQVCKCYVINSKSAMLWAFRRAMDVSW